MPLELLASNVLWIGKGPLCFLCTHSGALKLCRKPFFFFLRSSSLGRDFYWIRYIFEVDNHLKNDRLDLDSKFHKRALNKISL